MSVQKFEIGKTYKCVDVGKWSAIKGNKEALSYFDTADIIFLDPDKYRYYSYGDSLHIEDIETGYSIFIEEKDNQYFVEVNNTKSTPQPTQTASDTKDTPMSYDKFETLLRASQHLSQGVTVTPEGKFSVYSEYHEEELTFDSIDMLEEYVNLIKKLNSFSNK